MVLSLDVTTFGAQYFNSFHKNEFIQRSGKTDGQIGNLNTIICAVEFQFPYDVASKVFRTTMMNIFIAVTRVFSLKTI